jgi:hypothetical protein
MARWQTISFGLFVLGAVLALMALTNPDSAAYETYLVEQIADRASSECQQAPAGFGEILKEPCQGAIQAAKPHVRKLIDGATTRQNFGLFSRYTSDLSIPELKFNARVESIGAFDRFYTYKLP